MLQSGDSALVYAYKATMVYHLGSGPGSAPAWKRRIMIPTLASFQQFSDYASCFLVGLHIDCFAAYDLRSIDELSGLTAGRLGYIRQDKAHAVWGTAELALRYSASQHSLQDPSTTKVMTMGRQGVAGAWATPQHLQCTNHVQSRAYSKISSGHFSSQQHLREIGHCRFELAFNTCSRYC